MSRDPDCADEGDAVVLHATEHWIGLWPIVAAITSASTGLLIRQFIFPNSWIAVASFCAIAVTILWRYRLRLVDFFTTQLFLTRNRVVRKSGWFKLSKTELRLDKIEQISYEVPILGRLLGYGTVTLAAANELSSIEEDIANVESFVSAIRKEQVKQSSTAVHPEKITWYDNCELEDGVICVPLIPNDAYWVLWRSISVTMERKFFVTPGDWVRAGDTILRYQRQLDSTTGLSYVSPVDGQFVFRSFEECELRRDPKDRTQWLEAHYFFGIRPVKGALIRDTGASKEIADFLFRKLKECREYAASRSIWREIVVFFQGKIFGMLDYDEYDQSKLNDVESAAHELARNEYLEVTLDDCRSRLRDDFNLRYFSS